MMLKHFVPVMAGLMLAGVASAQESTTTPPVPPVPPIPPQVFRHMEVFTAGGGFLGVVPGDVTPENMKSLGLTEEYGVVLNDVMDSTPAKSAGLQKNDVVIGWNGTRVESAAQLRRLIHETPVGRAVKIDYIRGGSRKSAEVKIGEQKMPPLGELMNLPEGMKSLGDLMKMPEGMNFKDGELPKELHFEFKDGEMPKGMIFKDGEAPMQFEFKDGEIPQDLKLDLPEGLGTNGSMTVITVFSGDRMGTELQNVSPQLAKYFGLDNQTGALIGSVKEKSAAADAGLQAGDIITAIDGTPITSAAQAFKVLGDHPEGNAVMAVIRDHKELSIPVKLPKQEKIEGFGIPNMKFRFRNGSCGPKAPSTPSTPSAPATPDTQKKSEGDAKLSQLDGRTIYKVIPNN